jgi:hypothetical protein
MMRRTSDTGPNGAVAAAEERRSTLSSSPALAAATPAVSDAAHAMVFVPPAQPRSDSSCPGSTSYLTKPLRLHWRAALCRSTN